VRPCLELLEDRALPAIAVYTGTETVLRDAVADNTPATTAVRLHIPDSRTVAGVDVVLDISHGRTSDLSATLIAPDGRRVPLFTAVGGTGRHFRGTVLADDAPTPVSSAPAPFVGRFRPQGTLTDLAGIDTRGEWTLELTDAQPGDFGVLNAWSLLVHDGGSGEVAGNHDADHAFPVTPGDRVDGIIHTGEVDYFAVQLDTAGYLEAEVRASGDLDPKLTLSSPSSPYFSNGLPTGGGGLLATSDDRAAGDVRPLTGLYVQPGRYFLAVAAGGDGVSTAYTLTTRFQPDDSLFHPLIATKTDGAPCLRCSTRRTSARAFTSAATRLRYSPLTSTAMASSTSPRPTAAPAPSPSCSAAVTRRSTMANGWQSAAGP
jgi:subtilisin-like proprotein convertase family protein